MIKVVIVDDEPKLRQGLQTLIPWESLGCIVTATAANGKEALGVIEEKAPDVVIVDIRMPVMDGLQLIEHLRSGGHHMHFMILSGYADFEYAKQAIKYGVFGYLLKPVDIDEMSSSLKQIRERIEEERLQEEWRKREGINRDLYLHSLLVPQEKTEDPAKLRSKAIEAGLLWTSYEVVVVYPRVSEVDRSDVAYQLSNGLKAKIEGQMMGLVTVIPPYTVLLLNAPLRGKERREILHNEIHSVADNVRFAAATGGAVSAPEDIYKSFLKAQEAVKQSFFSEKNRLLGPYPFFSPALDSPRLSADKAEDTMEEFIFRLYYSLEVGNQAAILPLLNETAAFFLKQGQDEKSIKESFFFLSNAIIHKLTAGFCIELKETEEVSRFLNGIYQHDHLHDLLEETHRFLLTLAQDSESRGKEQEFKKMIDFIHKHYADNLRLEALAGLLNYSTAYLGQLFKNKTGEYFNTYLDRVRIQKAKELLGQGMKVYEVAESVGYTSVNYFYSKFKRYEGRSPSEYRNP
ncbi:response regulator transcription factor [Paenibacillus sp. CMAA1739]|uniref:response regulator transcription factor n=1 Tax=Paenibacillus ottowii TaxID=2315729 RepID=UPI00272F9ABC|nr:MULTISPECIES: response regulator transcription factor [Paenibacillus]MDP1512393.1 response regulator transcription factor [Paenibacillus ottowii]MEC4568362.1 response regulator transcription factor [Paenibacillus sp. CMAA1739]